MLAAASGSNVFVDTASTPMSIDVLPNVTVASLQAALSSKVTVKTGVFDYSYVASIAIVNSELVAKSANTLFTGDKVIVTAVDGSFETYTVVLTTDDVSVKKVGVVKDVVADQITVAYGTQVSEFLSALVSVDGRPQTYQLKYNNVNYNPAAPASHPTTFINPSTSWTLVVTSATGYSEEYDIVISSSSSTSIAVKAGSEFLISGINNTGLEINLHYATTLLRVQDSLIKADGSPLGTVAIIRPGVVGAITDGSTQIFNGDKLVITKLRTDQLQQII